MRQIGQSADTTRERTGSRWAAGSLLLLGLLAACLLTALATAHPAYADDPPISKAPEATADVAYTPPPAMPSFTADPLDPNGSNEGAPTSNPAPSTPSAQPSPSGSLQTNTLRDFAEMHGWPTAVTTDLSGRAWVRRSEVGADWLGASVRDFDFSAVAGAGFESEQEDARLGGYTVTTEPFYSMRAYYAVLRDQAGQPVERRFRWLADSYVLGIDAHGPSTANDDLRALARELLAAAVKNGLVVPQEVQATATQTAAAEPTSPPTCEVHFRDVPDDYWAVSYISTLACKGVATGYSDNTFRPQSPTTRAQLTKMVVLLQGFSLVDPERPAFTDVSRTHPFYQYIETAYAHKLVAGYEGNRFKPDAPVSRAQVAKIVVLARGWPLQLTRKVNLCDVQPSHWAYTYVQVAMSHGVFSGYGDGCFHPDDNATRAQLAKVLVLAGP